MRKIFAVAAIIISSPLLAQEDSTISSPLQGNHPMDKVVITTHKYPKKQSQTGKVVTVIDREMIDQMGARTIGEMLNTVAGTVINGANNNLGTNLRSSIRGSSDGNVLVLVDGIPVNDPSLISNYFDLNFFSSSQVERIEILKGGQSTLYGTDAVAGVINIITRKAGNRPVSPYASVNYGSYNTFNANAGVRGSGTSVQYNLGASFITSGGFSSAYDSTESIAFEKDGFSQKIFRGDLNLKLTRDFQWKIFGNYSRYDADIDAAAFTDDRDFIAENRNFQAGTGLQWKHKNGSLKMNYHFSYIDRFYLDDSTHRGSFSYYSKSLYLGRTHFIEVYDTYQWNRVSLLAGIDHRYFNSSQEYSSMSMFGPFETKLGDTAEMKQTSPYASLVYNHNLLNIELGGRWNHHSVYGDNFTYTFNPSYFIRKKVKLFANISSAFKTPSLYQLFDPFIGNKQLDPEKTRHFEAGAELYASNLFIRGTYFNRTTTNAIQFIITDPVFFSGLYTNINNQKNYGAELELGYQNQKWQVKANYTYTKGKISSAFSESGNQLPSDTTYNNLYRVPENAFNIFAVYHFNKKFSVNTLAKYTGSRLEPIYSAAPAGLESYFTIDLSGQFKFNEKFRAFIDLKNLSGKQYFDVLGYNSRKFNWSVGIDMSW